METAFHGESFYKCRDLFMSVQLPMPPAYELEQLLAIVEKCDTPVITAACVFYF